MILQRSDAVVDKILPLMLVEHSKGDLVFLDEMFESNFPDLSDEEINFYAQEMESLGLIVINDTFVAKAELTPFARRILEHGGWLQHLSNAKEEKDREAKEKEEDRELNRRSAEAAEMAAKSAEKSADWSVSSARTAKWSMWASWVLLAITTFGIGVSAKKIKEVEVLELKLSEQQKEIEQLKEEMDSLRAIVGHVSEIEQKHKAAPIKR